MKAACILKRSLLPLLGMLLLSGPAPLLAQVAKPAAAEAGRQGDAGPSLADARKSFHTRLIRRESDGRPIPVPPANIFSIVRYDSGAGKLGAYLSPNPRDGKKHPAIIWLTGGDSNTIDDLWHDAPVSNDQTAAAYRKAGIIMMYPSLRGGNDNPGVREAFLGEADDILAAADFLGKQAYVDPDRIYLGGHSTGGTLVLLAAASSARFRAVFSFGPVAEVAGYGPDMLPFDTSNPRELALRSPVHWLQAIRVPVFVFEGADQGNIESLQALSVKSQNARIRFIPVPGATHFSLLAPANRLVAEKILRDDGPVCKLAFSADEMSRLFKNTAGAKKAE